MSGIWIIRIFISISLLAPFIYWINSLIIDIKYFYYFNCINIYNLCMNCYYI